MRLLRRGTASALRRRFDGMTDVEAEVFVEKVLSERPDLFKRIGDDWELWGTNLPSRCYAPVP
jgi:hypothetical protein